MPEILQYDIVLVNLDPTIGSEMKKTRPCVVLSPSEMNRYLRTVIIAPLTSTSKLYPSRVNITGQVTNGAVALDQIRTIDRTRIIKTIETISPEAIAEIKAVIKAMLVD